MGHSTYAITGGSGPSLWSHGTKQYGCYVDSVDEIRFCQFDRATKALEGTLALSTIAGNPLSLPLDTGDPHESASIGVTPNGIIYVAGNNMDDATPRMVKTTGAVPGTNPLSAANWADASSDIAGQASSTFFYFKFCRFAGSLLLIYSIRLTGGNPSGSRMYRHNGTSWTDLGFISHGQTGTEDAFYRTHVFVEAPTSSYHPNRGHLFGAWDFATGGGGPIVDNFSYLYTDDEGSTWRDIDDVLVTTPFNATTTPDTGFTFGDPATTNVYGNGTAIDANGYPCGTYTNRAVGRQRIIRWDGSGWMEDQSLGSRPSNSNLYIVYFRDDLWTLMRPGGAGDTTKIELRRVAAPNDLVHMAGPVGSGWQAYFDPVALQETGVIETLLVNDDAPSVHTFGNHTRAAAA